MIIGCFELLSFRNQRALLFYHKKFCFKIALRTLVRATRTSICPLVTYYRSITYIKTGKASKTLPFWLRGGNDGNYCNQQNYIVLIGIILIYGNICFDFFLYRNKNYYYFLQPHAHFAYFLVL